MNYTPSSEEQRTAVEAKRNVIRMDEYRRRVEIQPTLLTQRLNLVTQILREYGWDRYGEAEWHAANRRARRVLESGGDWCCAAYHAMQKSPDGPLIEDALNRVERGDATFYDAQLLRNTIQGGCHE
jgi:hypothetical protein